MLNEIFELFRDREPIPFIILAVVCAGWVVIVERLVVLQFIYRVNFSRFNPSLRRMLAAGDLDRARAFCLATSKTGIPLIIAKAIDAYQSDTFKVRMTVSEEILSLVPRIRRRVSQLPNLATAAVLLGSLGAVEGVWESFHVADVLEMGVKSMAFSKGLSHAMTPLALALFSAIILMIPYGFLDAIAMRLEGDMEHSLTMALNILAPETQTVVAAQPMVGAPAFVAQTESMGDSGAPAAAMESSMASSSRGLDEDVAIEKGESIPDEEEII